MTFPLDASVETHDLNQHPFYRAWREGTLPQKALLTYAVEYAPFIAAVAEGWATLGDATHAGEELAHARMWSAFREALGAGGEPACEDARSLVTEARASFASPTSAVGALYAFEAQQPSTAKSKLEGLREHYGIDGEAAAYFTTHAGDYGEREVLRARYEALSPVDREAAARACERMCAAMWQALSGVLAATTPGSSPVGEHRADLHC